MKPVRVLLVVGLVLGVFVACGKRTAEGERARYQATRDRIEALGTKNPAMKVDLLAKLAEFEKEFRASTGLAEEEAVKTLTALNSRMAGYENTLNPKPGPTASPDAGKVLGSKLGAPPPDAGKALGSKLGAAGAPDAAPTGGKLGAGAGPATQPAKSGFGGGAPDAPKGSGFGGK